MRIRGTIAFIALLALGICAPAAASAESLSMTFTEDRANVGEQLFDDPMFTAPETAPFEAEINPGNGSITGGVLQVPEFMTHITHPLEADVAVEFEIGVISGSYDKATGALTLEGEAGGTLISEGNECAIVTTPNPLVLTTAGNSGGTTNPRSGIPFTHGLTGAGAIAGQWTNMEAEPINGHPVACEVVEENIEGPGGVWLYQQGDIAPPSAPKLTSTSPASPGPSDTPRILGSAEKGSTVHIYAGSSCGGASIATGSAAELSSPGISVKAEEGVNTYSATATDAAGNTSACSAPISYTDEPPCVVPKLKGKSLRQAKTALEAAHCSLGKVRKPKGKGLGKLVVKSSKPKAGKRLENGAAVSLKLGQKPRKGHHRHH